MASEEVTEGDDLLKKFEDKWSDPTGSYYYCLVLPNGDVEYHGTKGALQKRLNHVYNRE